MLINTALVIVDMQLYFIEKRKNYYGYWDEQRFNVLLNSCIHMIKFFKKNNLPIIVLEYDINGYDEKKFQSTHKDIMDELKDYDKVTFGLKYDDSGYVTIKKILKDLDMNISSFLVCGVNGDACVKKTILDLVYKKSKNVNVIVEATDVVYFEEKRHPKEYIPNESKITFSSIFDYA